MELWQAFLLALIQGVTEFLPISSSAHLVLLPSLTGWEDQGLAFDVAVHLGSLGAVLVYYREEILKLVVGFLRAPLLNSSNSEFNNAAKLSWLLVASTLPTIVLGVLFNAFVEENFRNYITIGLSSIVFGVILLAAYKRETASLDLVRLTLGAAIFIGFAQAFAIIPGASRSGVTLTAGLLVGLSVRDAAKYSFLLSIPTILGAAVFMLIGDHDKVSFLNANFIVGIVVSALSAYLCIDLFIRFVTKIGIVPFVVYRCLLGLLLLGYWFTRLA